MSAARPQELELHRLTLEVLEGTAASGDFARLQELLRGNPEFQVSYLQMVDLCNTLSGTLSNETLVARSQSDPQSTELAQADWPHLAPGTAPPGAVTPSPEIGPVGLSTQITWERAGSGQRRLWNIVGPRWGLRATLGATFLFAVLVYGTFSVLVWEMGPRMHATSSATSQAVGRVDHLTDVNWSHGSPQKDVRSDVQQGESLQITGGRVRLALRDGVKLHIEGPASWVIDSANEITLHAGTVHAQVPREAVGFVLNTPLARIVDLGTEFRASADEVEGTGVEVLQGTVRVEPLPDDHSTENPEQLLLTRGEQVQILASSGANRPLVRWTKHFATSGAGTAAADAQAQLYFKTLLALQPVFYFSMDRSDGESPRDRAHGAYQGQLTRSDGSADWWEAGPFGDSLRFRGSKYDDRLTITPQGPRVGSKRLDFSNGTKAGRPFSVVAWVRCRPGQTTGTLVGHGEGFNEQFLLDVLSARFRFVVPAVERVPNVPARQVISQDLFDGTWQHMAGVFDPDHKELRLYVNGRLNGVERFTDTTVYPGNGVIYIGNRPDQFGDNRRLTLDGAIDEVALIPRAIRAEEVRTLFLLQPARTSAGD